MMMENNLAPVVRSFAPVVHENSEILILGSMPGEESLRREEYYAAPSNNFWKFIKELFNSGKDFESYNDKLECLQRNRIALWDSLQMCEREGSLDSNIRNGVPNDIDGLLKRYPKIRKIVFNGKTASKYYSPTIPYCVALSTSGLCARTRVEKLQNWIEALEL